ncbi:GCR1_C domain-containing protein [Trichoderma simmonsii]|uniref:GCR1_C domain-containing protein n=1 Tax=Trichoderma simmonsii TaxID=1491479 RepID=A0A8G0LAU8_9HYPO|nr:GCR1_C domain-containing protein [Trichoderma simmonsii]
MVHATASNEMERQESRGLALTANRPPSCSNNHSCPSKSPLALRTRKTRSTAPSTRCSVPSVSAPSVLPGDPPGSDTYLRGVGLRPGRANRRITPKKSIVPIIRNKKDNNNPKCVEESETTVAVDVLDYLPMEVAKMVINMQQYYAAGVEELMGKLSSMSEEVRLARKENEELLEKLAGLSEDVVLEREEGEEMRRRLDMHFVMLRQANKFMQSVRDGSLGGVEGADDVPTLVEEEEENDDVRMTGLDMEVPPVPSVDREPVRSTGRKVPKRRAGGSYGLRRKGKKRQTRMKKASTTEKGVHFEDGSDAMEVRQAEVLALDKLREEEAPQEEDDDDEDDDHLKILAGAPRLQAMLRKSAWTAINHNQNNTDPNADYRPHSPSSASESSSSPSPRSPSPTPLPRRPQTPTATTPTKPSSSSPQSSSSSRPRYSTPRHTTLPRYASGPPSRPFRFHRMGRTVLDVWTEYKHGKKGNPAIESLERQYATGWRTGTLREIKYASNYVGVRQKVVSKVEEICAREGIEPEEACRRLDERVDGRMQMLITAVRKGEDPFEVIPKR